MHRPAWDSPSFFKVMIGGFRTTLRIPPSFMKHIGEKISKSSVVRNFRGMQWEIKMETLDGELFFRDGWKIFVSDNAVSLGDVLIFLYNGDVGFDVRIYGSSGCEKDGFFQYHIGALKIKQREEEVNNNAIAGKKTICISVNREKVSRKRKRGSVLGRDPVKKSKLCYKVIRAAKAVENKKALKAACAIKITNPHFVATCRDSRAEYMTIPLGLAKKYNLIEKKSTHLRDPHGTSWPVKLSHWRDGRVCLSSGWAAFYQKNGLKQGDVCVFEIVEGGSLINVHIFHAQDYSANSVPRSGERLLTEDEKRVLKAAKSFESSHIKFVGQWRHWRLYHMPIPKKVAVEVGIHRNQSTTLYDPSGKQWVTQIVLRSQGQVEFGTGWSNFSRANNLALGDACVFEFVGGADTIKVHIFRVGET